MTSLAAQSLTQAVRGEIVWAPHPGSQVIFLSCPIYECLLQGTRGGGKTDALLMDYAQHVGRGFGAAWRGILFRQTYPQLADVVAKSKKLFYRIFPGAKFNASDYTWTFPGGEQLLLRHMKTPDDYWNYHGHEYPWIGFEELTNWPTAECYESMFACSRSSHPGMPRKYRATCNPYGRGHCVPYGDVLTPNGWRDIKDIKIGDTVYSVDSAGAIVEKTVEQLYRGKYIGDMVYREGRGIFMAMTPNHSLPKIGGKNGQAYTLVPFEELPGQADILRTAEFDGEPIRIFECPVYPTRSRRVKQPARISGMQFAELMGWFLSEGSTIDRDKAFNIAQMKPKNRERIAALLDECGFKQSWNANDVTVYAPDWWAYLRQFGKCRDKYVPAEIKNASREQITAFCTAAMNGDGHWSGTGGCYYTTSQRLADDMAELFVKLGYAVNVSSRARKNRDGLSYTVHFKRGRTIQLVTGQHRYNVKSSCASVNVRRESFDGEVYCIGVADTHSFFIRQNGSVWLSGNTWVKQRFIDPAPSGTVIREPGKPERVNIHSSLLENTHLLAADPEYLTKLRAISDPNKRKAWLFGSWEITSGGMFDDLWKPEAHIVPVFDIPAGWRIDRSLDWGSSRPFSVGWWAESDGSPAIIAGRQRTLPRGTLVRLAEWYGSTGKANEGLRLTAGKVAEGIKQRQVDLAIAQRVKPGPADSSIFDVTDEASIADNMAKIGIRWEPADKRAGSRKNGWELMRERMEASLHDNGKPGFLVMDRCRDFIRLVPSTSRDEDDPDDIDTESEDHIHDETRYRVLATARSVRTQALPF
ncbi:hypothetical protein FHW12_000341 [Dokdonella fugitiva]|uniref:DOD-type homing endonuclease domain-containing protein n=1 Tax=Dokdonella fugitiva TaxID=328517 RepID=A0A839EZ10_9GAMM|nr:hypothetical protein [Dokdonella fugitiva]MBA8886150.1 hypothetical protein [Dokdonella fugitiva]